MSRRETKRQILRQWIEAAFLQELLVLQDKFKFLPGELLRCRACANLGIPWKLSRFGRMVIDWPHISDTFKLKPKRGPHRHGVSRELEVKPVDGSLISPYEGPRKFFRYCLPRPPTDQCREISFREPCSSQSTSQLISASTSRDKESALDDISSTNRKKSNRQQIASSWCSVSDDGNCFLNETGELFPEDPLKGTTSPLTTTSWSSISEEEVFTTGDFLITSTPIRKE